MSSHANHSPHERAGPVELTESDRHRLLTAERRRVALEILSDRGLPIDLTALAAAIAARDDDTDQPQSEHADRVAITLHHQHLPMMTEMGVIRYEPTSNRVEAVNPVAD